MDAAVRESASTDVGAEARAGQAVEAAPMQGLWRWVKSHYLFLVTVALPTLTATVYYGFIASDVYVSVSRFVVHSQQQPMQPSGLLGAFLDGTGMSRTQNDAYAVRDFIVSRDALRQLGQSIDVRKAYASHAIDVFDRFPGMHWDASFEAFYQYYGKHVGVDYDPESSISVLTVSAFTPEEAYKINNALLSMSERLVNSLNDRSRQDLIRFADNDVKVAEQKAANASLALLAYRSSHAVFEPDKQAAIQLQGVAHLQAELISTDAELAQLRQLSPSNPQIPGLQSRADTLRDAIATQASKVTGGSGSLSARAPEFERLALESEIADKELGAALAELDSARRDAARQQVYLERLVQPNLPDSSLTPRRVRSVTTILAVGMILWGVLALIIASIKEHTQ